MDAGRLEKLRDERAIAIREMVALTDAAEVEQRDLTDEESAKFDECEKAVEERDVQIRQLEKVAALKPQLDVADVAPETEARAAQPHDSSKHEKTYRPDNIQERSFFADLMAAKDGDWEARQRLNRNSREALDYWGDKHHRRYDTGAEFRDMSTTLTAGGDFLPPLYMGELWVHPSMAGRNFADALPSYPLPPKGMTVTIPSLDSGVTVAGRLDLGTVSETDGVTSTKTLYVREFAGRVDVGRIELRRSDPAFETVIMNTLQRRYNVAVDVSLFSGAGGTAASHLGLDSITPNTVTWTSATPTGVGFLGQIYSAIASIDTNRIEVEADMIVMHGRRAAWASQTFSGTSGAPVIQLGSLFQALGQQDGGFTYDVAGLRLIRDNNITTTNGASTNEDKIYVLASQDFLFAEGPMYTRIDESLGQVTGAVGLNIFADSLFISNRYPKSCTVISGTGLVAPTFNS